MNETRAATRRSSLLGATYPSIVVWNASKLCFAGEGNLPQCSAFEKGERAASRLSGEQAYLVLGSAAPGWGHAAPCLEPRSALLLSTSWVDASVGEATALWRRGWRGGRR